MNHGRYLNALGLGLCTAFVVTGCSLQPVAPWERGVLARPAMQLIPHAVDHALDEHIYFSKEASSGGQGVGGGGCGCN